MPVADIDEIRVAIAAQVTSYTGLSCLPDMPDQVTVPMAAVLPKLPWKYGVVLDGGQPRSAAQDLDFHVLIVISRAQDIADVQAQLDGYLGVNASVPSIADAFTVNPGLDGLVSWCEAMQVDHYGPMDIAGQPYFTARIAVNVGT